MWRRKMAARISGEDGHLNTGKSESLLYNTSNELVPNRSQEESVDAERRLCDDHSILAIFEDSTASENPDNVEEESEILLSALTEMLDSVEEDEDPLLSPLSILQDSEFLGRGRRTENAVSQKLSPSRRCRPRVRPQNESFKMKSDGGKHQECKLVGNHLPKMLEAKVEVFNSMSLVSLVNLMHPYCLKLEVETEDTPRKSESLFSQEEVWRYEQPTEESDEEINVVSDDEAPVKGRKEEDAGGNGDEGRLLKSALMNGNTSRERKSVSFGPVQVASFDESVALKSTKAPETAGSSTLEPSVLINDRILTDAQRERENKGETKAKSLSLQEYRQLRQNKRPLVEKQGNYTTKWPSVSEPPKALTPILCFQMHNYCKPKMTHFYSDFHKPHCEASSHHGCLSHTPNLLSPHLHHSKLKSSRTESKTVSPTSPLPGDTAGPKVLEGKRSPVKKTTLLSIDPPNPVLLPLPVAQTASPKLTSKSRVESSRDLQETQNESSAATEAISSEQKPHLLSLNKDFNLTVTQEIKTSNTTITGSSVPSVETESVSNAIPSQRRVKLLPKNPPSPSPDPVQPIKCLTSPVGQCPPVVEASRAQREELPHIAQNNCPSKEPSPPPTERREPSAAVTSGIEAPDLTSLLEQFEETQALEDKTIETESKPVPDTLLSDLPAGRHMDGAESAGSARTSSLQLKPSAGPLESLSPSENVLDLPPVEPVHIPEPLCTEIVLSSHKEQPARRKNPPSKSIQIIDPRPLPPKKTHTGPAELPPAHCYSYLSLDHNYCRSGDLSPVSQCNGVKSFKPSTEQQLEHQDSAPEEGKKHTQYHPEQFWTGSEALRFTGGAAVEDGGTSKTQIPQSILPTPPPSPPVRGRDKRRYRRRSPSSDSSSRSRSSSSSSSSSSCASCSPKRRRIRLRRSESSSCSSSPSFVSRLPPPRYRLSYSRSANSRSRSRSWSRSRSPSHSRSPSPLIRRGRWRGVRSSRESRKLRREHEMRVQKLKAIDERRVVYVGRIRKTMTHDELRERFSQFGEVECVSLHFRDRGDHYGFVTFYNMEDAFAAIDNGGKLRKTDELPFDICFGGRRQFCNSDYADLDANREADPSPSRSRIEDLDFDSLLKQAQKGLKR